MTLAFAAEQVADWLRKAPGCSVGILVRQNETVARLIHQLRGRGVHASEEGGHPLTDSAAVQLVLSLLTLADHPGDTIARFHLAHSPWNAVLGLSSHDDRRGAVELAARVRCELMDNGYGPTLFRWARDLEACCDPRSPADCGS